MHGWIIVSSLFLKDHINPKKTEVETSKESNSQHMLSITNITISDAFRLNGFLLLYLHFISLNS